MLKWKIIIDSKIIKTLNELIKYRNDKVNRILVKNKHPLPKVKKYISKISNTKIRQIETIAKNQVKLLVEDNKLKIRVETHYESAEKHLEYIINQLSDDIYPLFATKDKAPFTILRNTLCFCDYISRLRFKKKGSSGDLQTFFESFGSYEYIKIKYSEYKDYLIQLYRHEVVHTLRPWSKVMLLKRGGLIKYGNVGWNLKTRLPQKLENGLKSHKDTFSYLSSELRSEKNRKKLFHLRLSEKSNSPVINIYCLFFDLVNYVSDYKSSIEEDIDQQVKLMKNLIEIEVENYFNLLFEGIQIMDFDNNKIVR